MKKVLLILFILMVSINLRCVSAELESNTVQNDLPLTFEELPNIFIYPLAENTEQEDCFTPDELLDYVSPVEDEDAVSEDDEIPLFTAVEQVNSKDYAEFVDDANSIYLKDASNNYVVNLRVPQKITSSQALKLDNKIHNERLLNLSKYSKEEYNISGNAVKNVYKTGGLSFGTTYDSSVDKISMLENSAKLFTRYETKRFALSSAYEKTMNTTIGTYSDAFYLSPEFKLNNYFSIKEVLSADITKNRKSSELVFSVAPYGNSGANDRLRFEVGAKQTIDQNNALYGTQLNFSTKFKL